MLGNALPLLVYGSLSGIGINTADPAFVVLQFAFMPLTILQFAIGIAMAQGPMSRLFALPVSSNAIVAWHTLSGAMILALETAFSACVYNSLFHAEWPIVGPMLFAAAVWSSLQLLQFVPSQPSLSGMCLASSPLFAVLLWIQSRYGAWLSPPKHYWREATIADSVTLIMAVLIGYAMATIEVRFARCSEPLPRLGVSKWLTLQWEKLTLGTVEKAKFRSAFEAQLWYEFRLKGWALPFLSAILAYRAAKFVLAGLGIAIGYLILTASIQAPREVIQQIHVVSITILSALIVLLTFWVFHRCSQAKQLNQKTLILAVTISCGVVTTAFLLRPTHPPIVAYPLTLAIASLAVLPFAAMPLTIGASRHR